jgi:hypothetical protein
MEGVGMEIFVWVLRNFGWFIAFGVSSGRRRADSPIPSWRRRWSARRIGDERELEMFFHHKNIENDFIIL